MNRREIEAIFGLGDIKQTRVDREVLEEGELRVKIATVPRLAAMGWSAEQIATALALNIEEVGRIIASREERNDV